MNPRSVIGIDIGTTKSCVAVFKDGIVQVIPNKQGNRTTPSMVAFHMNDVLAGELAKLQIDENPENTVVGLNRLIGRNIDDPLLQANIKNYPFRIIIEEENTPKIEVKYRKEVKQYSTEKLNALMIFKLKSMAERYLDSEVSDAVISVPSHFNNSQRQAVIDSSKQAGLNVLRIVNDSTLAAIAYGRIQKILPMEQNILVYDLGGGTLSVAILHLDEIYKVKASSGNVDLGGEDFLDRIVKHFVEEIKITYHKDITQCPTALQRLRNECEAAKKALSSYSKIGVHINQLFEGTDFESIVSREQFEFLCEDLFRKTLDPVLEVLTLAKMSMREIDEVILVGGSTRIPKIQQLLSEFFNGKPLNKSLNGDEAIAHGAAIHAAMCSDHNQFKDLLVLDVSSLSVGVDNGKGIMDPVIRRSTGIPTTVSRRYETVQRDQSELIVQVWEGGDFQTKQNHLVGNFKISGIQPSPVGTILIETSFNIDVNGILTISATEYPTGNHLCVTRSQEPVQLSAMAVSIENEKIRRIRMEQERKRAAKRREQFKKLATDFKELMIREPKIIIKNCDKMLQWLEENRDCSESEVKYKFKGALGYLDRRIAKFSKAAGTDRYSHGK
ncbi:hypothetical protein GCK72_000511 [Caenorhabditis remanei]|uniref:Uncharacterized protein n=1 Tax=Caenorhabditis remanei TaxID=31234 RepID=A0A6A5HLD1_CAERE|nr:hypothetical protein GCK72_000511 [Caenorhabditis remanei]KAF1768698.1 hypothetical protein GCK72_000511 [Caenorhabditis remanei]